MVVHLLMLRTDIESSANNTTAIFQGDLVIPKTDGTVTTLCCWNY
jgi:hypothetical protein